MFRQGDIGVGGREVGYLFGQYKRIKMHIEGGVLTGKMYAMAVLWQELKLPVTGLIFFMREMLKAHNNSLEGKAVILLVRVM